MSKYLKVMFGTKSSADSNFEYKTGEVNVAENWNPNAEDPKKATEDIIDSIQ